MTLLFAANECAGLTPSDSGVTELATGDFDTNYVRGRVYITGGATYASTIVFAAQTAVYTHWEGTQRQPLVYKTQATWLTSDGQEVIRLRGDLYSVYLDYWNGSAWVSLSGAIGVSTQARQKLDLYISTTNIKLYVASTERFDSGAISIAALTNIASVRFYSAGIASIDPFAVDLSQVVISTDPTMGWAASTRYPTGAGATSAWDGTWANVDELTYTDADYISTDTNNETSTFEGNTPTISSYAIKGVTVNLRAKRGATGPTRVAGVVRVGGTDYVHATPQTLSLGYSSYVFIWPLNPATGVAWTPAEAGACEFGAKSLA